MTDFSFDQLRRVPDIEAPNLVAVDATDRLLLDESAELIQQLDPAELAIIDDRYGALTLGAAAIHGASEIRVHQDPLISEFALARNAKVLGREGCYRNLSLDEELLSNAKVVLVQAPKSLAALREISELVARYAHDGVTLYVGGRVKHLTFTMNQVLGTQFGEVHASLARQKSRLLVATKPQRSLTPFSFPNRHFNEELNLWICASGAAFAGTKLDLGTRFLFQFIDHMKPTALDAVDLGCGTAILGAALAVAREDVRVIATDQSWAAVSSAEATIEANALSDRVTVQRDDAMSQQLNQSADLILCNPPFHNGTSVQAEVAPRMFAAAGRVLRPGGELWTVFNSHLDYRTALHRSIGDTRIVERNAKFSVCVSVRDGSTGA